MATTTLPLLDNDRTAKLTTIADALLQAMELTGISDTLLRSMPVTVKQAIRHLNSDQAADHYLGYRLLLLALSETPDAAARLIALLLEAMADA